MLLKSILDSCPRGAPGAGRGLQRHHSLLGGRVYHIRRLQSVLLALPGEGGNEASWSPTTAVAARHVYMPELGIGALPLG